MIFLDLGDILKTIFDKEGQIDLMKMDCEGCEYSLLKLDKETIKLPRQYIIEIHGSETPILDKMTDRGYNVKLVKRVNQWITIYYFTVLWTWQHKGQQLPRLLLPSSA